VKTSCLLITKKILERVRKEKKNLLKTNLATRSIENKEKLHMCENFSLRLMYYSFYLAGTTKNIASLSPENMRLGLMRHKYNMHFRQFKGTKVRVRKRERHFLDELFSFVIN
jgi:hypothetical protein